MPLNGRQRAFVTAYVELGVAWKAYAKAYPDATEATAQTQGPRLLRNPQISDAVDKRQANLANELGLTRQWVLRGLAARAEDHDANDAARIRALELVGKAHGMFTDRALVDHNVVYEYTLQMGNPDVGADPEDEDDA